MKKKTELNYQKFIFEKKVDIQYSDSNHAMSESIKSDSFFSRLKSFKRKFRKKF